MSEKSQQLLYKGSKHSISVCELTLPVEVYPIQAFVQIIMDLWVNFRMEKSPNYHPCIFFDVTCLEHFIQPE